MQGRYKHLNNESTEADIFCASPKAFYAVVTHSYNQSCKKLKVGFANLLSVSYE